jgi:hypothetical protein
MHMDVEETASASAHRLPPGAVAAGLPPQAGSQPRPRYQATASAKPASRS